MPKPSTFPTILDELKDISIAFLSKHGYLIPGNIKQGIVTWSRNGMKTGSISIMVKMDDRPRLVLDYKCDDKPITNTVWLTSIPSNLGKGKVWYFQCTHTGKRCRKLHLINGHFMHRSALVFAMYDSQTKSKKWRQMERSYGCYFDSDNCYREIYSKHFKKYYNGRPTKRYKVLMAVIRKAERIPIENIERLFISGT